MSSCDHPHDEVVSTRPIAVSERARAYVLSALRSAKNAAT